MLDGRVKTLHPVVHGGLLARRDVEEHMTALAEQGIDTIDLVAVNLYPFRETASRPNVHPDAVIEQIDIGGPSMLRSAAKNFPSVFAVVDPADYARVLAALQASDDDLDLRRVLAAKVFAHTARVRRRDRDVVRGAARRAVSVADHRVVRARADPPLRRESRPACGVLRRARRRRARGTRAARRQGAVVQQSARPRGRARRDRSVRRRDLLRDREAHDALRTRRRHVGAWMRIARRSRATRRRHSARSSRSRRAVDAEAAEAVSSLFVECIVAPEFSPEALDVLGRKKNLRVLVGTARWTPRALDFKRVRGGVLAQERAPNVVDDAAWQVVTRRQPTAEERRDMLFAWRAVASVKSNAIVLVRDGATIGIGAGQMSRVDAAFVSVHKARTAGHDTAGAVMGSDAFFPFRDSVDQAVEAGVKAIVQPGGSIRDADVIAAADEHGVAMVFTGQRQFRDTSYQLSAIELSAISQRPGGR